MGDEGRKRAQSEYHAGGAKKLNEALNKSKADPGAVVAILSEVKSQDEWAALCRAYRSQYPKAYGGDLVLAIKNGMTADGEEKCIAALKANGVDFVRKPQKPGDKDTEPAAEAALPEPDAAPAAPLAPAAPAAPPEQPADAEEKKKKERKQTRIEEPAPAAPEAPGGAAAPADLDTTVPAGSPPPPPDPSGAPPPAPTDGDAKEAPVAPEDPEAAVPEDPEATGAGMAPQAAGDTAAAPGGVGPGDEIFTGETETLYVRLAHANESLGITMSRHELKQSGLVGPLFASEVRPGGAAARAGMREGDILKTINWVEITDMASAVDAMGNWRLQMTPGEVLEIQVVRTLTRDETRPLLDMNNPKHGLAQAGSMRAPRKPEPPPPPDLFEPSVHEETEEPQQVEEEVSQAPSSVIPEGWVHVPRRVVVEALERRMQEDEEEAQRVAERAKARRRDLRRPPLPFRGIHQPQDAMALARQLLLKQRQIGRTHLTTDGTTPAEAEARAESVIRKIQRDGLHLHMDALIDSNQRPPQQPLAVHCEVPLLPSEAAKWACLRDEMQELERRLDAALRTRGDCECADQFEAVRRELLGEAPLPPTGSSSGRRSAPTESAHRGSASTGRLSAGEMHELPQWAAVGADVEAERGGGWTRARVVGFSPRSGTCMVVWSDGVGASARALTALRPAEPVAAPQCNPEAVADAMHALIHGWTRDPEEVYAALGAVRSQEDWVEVQESFRNKYPGESEGQLLAAMHVSLTPDEQERCAQALQANGVDVDADAGSGPPVRRVSTGGSGLDPPRRRSSAGLPFGQQPSGMSRQPSGLSRQPSGAPQSRQPSGAARRPSDPGLRRPSGASGPRQPSSGSLRRPSGASAGRQPSQPAGRGAAKQPSRDGLRRPGSVAQVP